MPKLVIDAPFGVFSASILMQKKIKETEGGPLELLINFRKKFNKAEKGAWKVSECRKKWKG